MTCIRCKVPRLLLLGLAVWLSFAVCGYSQEAQRQLSGDLITGFSGLDTTGDSARGPYVGFSGNFSGYWKDPRILTFDINPTLVKGFEWSGPMSGPDSNGINANSTFLGGSPVPVSVFFSQQYIPTPDLGPQQSVNLQGFGRTQQTYGADWTARFKHLPVLNLHYSNSDYTAEYPLEFGGNVDSNNEDFRALARYDIAKWALNAGYVKTESSSQTLNLFDNSGQLATDKYRDQDISFSISRPLPFRSQMMMDADSHKSSLEAYQAMGNSNYERGSFALSSQPVSRLATNFQVSYISNYADYALQQLLVPSGTGVLPQSPLSSVDAGVVNYGAGASFRLTSFLTARGNYIATDILSTSAATTGFGEGNSAGGGLSFFHKLGGGQFSTSYDVSDSTIKVTIPIDSVSQSGTVAYTRNLPWNVHFTSAGSVTDTEYNWTYAETIRNYAVNFDADRQVNANWKARARVDYRKFTYDYPARTESSYKTFELALISRKLQLNVSRLYDSGLGYQFGTGVVLEPGAPPPPITVLPAFIETSGTSLNLAATYLVNKKFMLKGSWRNGHRAIADREDLRQHDINLRGEYAFRKVRLAAGYARDWQQFDNQQSTYFFSRYFYVELRRNFRLF